MQKVAGVSEHVITVIGAIVVGLLLSFVIVFGRG